MSVSPRTSLSSELSAPAAALGGADLERWHEHFAGRPPQDLLAWAFGHFAERIAIVTAFQAEGMVILDMAVGLGVKPRVITVDTGRLPQETHDVIDQVRRRYGLRVEILTPDAQAVEAMVHAQGSNLFYGSPEARHLCCRVRKLEPLKRALADLDAWITGVRRAQAPSRAGAREIEHDTTHGGLAKLNPLAAWSWEQIWAYIREHGVPYNTLYDQGFRSIGCAPCTRAVGPGENPRAGRWWWESAEEAKECGLHLPVVDDSPPALEGALR